MLKLRGSNPRASIPSPFGSGIAFSSSTITFQPIPNKHDLFCLCFTAGRQPHTHIRTLLAGETSSSFIAFMHPCTLDLCSYAEKLAKIHDFREYKVRSAAAVRGMLISPGMVVNVVIKILDHIVLVTLSVDLR